MILVEARAYWERNVNVHIALDDGRESNHIAYYLERVNLIESIGRGFLEAKTEVPSQNKYFVKKWLISTPEGRIYTKLETSVSVSDPFSLYLCQNLVLSVFLVYLFVFFFLAMLIAVCDISWF